MIDITPIVWTHISRKRIMTWKVVVIDEIVNTKYQILLCAIPIGAQYRVECGRNVDIYISDKLEILEEYSLDNTICINKSSGIWSYSLAKKAGKVDRNDERSILNLI